MTRISKDEGAHYEAREVPFGRSYKWYPERTVVECDCGEELAFAGTSVTFLCRCGAEYGDLVRSIRYREGRLRDEDVHSWHHDVQGWADQHSQDEAAYPEGSPGAKATQRRGWGTIERDGRRPDRSKAPRPANEISATMVRRALLHL